MMFIGLPLFVASLVAGHATVTDIWVDGTKYATYDIRIDPLLPPLKRIQYAYGESQGPIGPLQNVLDPAITCGRNPQAPALTAVARAGANVTLGFSYVIRMHKGPFIAYLGQLPSDNTRVQNVRFFKIFEYGYDAAKNRWGNEMLNDNGNKFTLRLPSDIKSGTYVFRPELWSLHQNFPGVAGLTGGMPQIYPQCYKIKIIGGGNASPPGVTFPGGYKKTDPAVSFAPYMGTGDGVASNKRFIIPGPPLYKGKYIAATGSAPVVQRSETGLFEPSLQARYDKVRTEIGTASDLYTRMADVVWPKNQPDISAVMSSTGKISKMLNEAQALQKQYKGELPSLRRDIAAAVGKALPAGQLSYGYHGPMMGGKGTSAYSGMAPSYGGRGKSSKGKGKL